jgi:hypothetical protein
MAARVAQRVDPEQAPQVHLQPGALGSKWSDTQTSAFKVRPAPLWRKPWVEPL